MPAANHHYHSAICLGNVVTHALHLEYPVSFSSGKKPPMVYRQHVCLTYVAGYYWVEWGWVGGLPVFLLSL